MKHNFIAAIDPGPTKSSMVCYDPVTGRVITKNIADNTCLLSLIKCADTSIPLAIEMIASYGMPVGAETFETCVWIGRFIQAWQGPHTLVYRKDVKLHLCGSLRAKDANVRQALIDLYGGKTAVGTKKKPGPLYGIKSHSWSALAVAVTWAQSQKL